MQIIHLITLLKYYVLQRSKIVYYAAAGRNWTFHVECDVSSTSRGTSRRRVLVHHTRRMSNFDRLLHTIFFITQIHVTFWAVKK